MSSARNAGESAIESARAQGRTFGNGWSVGLELVREESDQWRKAWRVERTSLCSFIGDGGASLCVHGLCDRVQV